MFVIIFLVVLFFVVRNMRPNGKQKVKIRYGSRTKKGLLISAAITTIAAIILFFLIGQSDKFENIPNFLYNAMGFIMILWIILLGAIVILWLAYLDAVFYIKELYEAGYVIPEKRSDYEGLFENLPKRADYNPEETVLKNKRSKRYMVLAFLAAAVGVGLLAAGVNFYFMWRKTETGYFLAIPYLVFAGIWVVAGRKLFIQSDNEVYRSEFEDNDKKLPRIQFFKGLLLIIILGFICAAGATFPYSMTKYIEKSHKAELGIDFQESITAMNQVYSRILDRKDTEWSTSYEMLKNGTDFDLGNWPDDLFKREVEVEVDRVVSDRFFEKVKKYDVRFEIWLEDGRIVGTMYYPMGYGKPEEFKVNQ